MTIVVRALQPLNAESPIVMTPAGIVIEVRALQLLNAYFPIVVMPAGSLTVVSEGTLNIHPSQMFIPDLATASPRSIVSIIHADGLSVPISV